MPGLTMLTALEIFTNPYDLKILIGQEKDSGKFSVGFFRGPGHNFKPMLTSKPFAETVEVAVESVKEILEAVQQSVTKEIEDRTSFASRFLNPDGREINQSKILSSDLISRIVEELRLHQVASTHKMLASV